MFGGNGNWQVILEQFASIGEIIAALAVVVTLIYLSMQIRQANLLSRSQIRQRMVEHSQAELYLQLQDPDIYQFFTREEELSESEQAKFALFLISAMRQREWEWFQLQDGAIDDEVFQAYHGVIEIHLGVPRTRRWWRSVGRLGFNPDFVKEVDKILDECELTQFFQGIGSFDNQ